MSELGMILLIVVYIVFIFVILKLFDWASKRERNAHV